MSRKLTGKALVKFEAQRDVWQEVLDGARAIKARLGESGEIVQPYPASIAHNSPPNFTCPLFRLANS